MVVGIHDEEGRALGIGIAHQQLEEAPWHISSENRVSKTVEQEG